MAFGFLEKLKSGLTKTRAALSGRVRELFRMAPKVDDAFLEQLEEILIRADCGVEAATAIVEDLRTAAREQKEASPEALYEILRGDIERRLKKAESAVRLAAEPPTVILVAGVNGTGKTTSIAKLAWYYSGPGQKGPPRGQRHLPRGGHRAVGIWAGGSASTS